MKVLITGASGAIGRGLALHHQALGHDVVCVTSQTSIDPNVRSLPQLDWHLDCHYEAYSTRLVPLLSSNRFDQIYHCAGGLHWNGRLPEKSIAQFSPDFFLQNMQRNCLSAMALVQSLDQTMNKSSETKVAMLSAMVGSISDNQLGGWYSYRASKAALNMLIKTVSIEWKRRFPDASIIALHPGTTDSELSRPFQKNLNPNKLYSAKLTAKRLTLAINQVSSSQSGAFLNWDGGQISW